MLKARKAIYNSSNKMKDQASQNDIKNSKKKKKNLDNKKKTKPLMNMLA